MASHAHFFYTTTPCNCSLVLQLYYRYVLYLLAYVCSDMDLKGTQGSKLWCSQIKLVVMVLLNSPKWTFKACILILYSYIMLLFFLTHSAIHTKASRVYAACLDGVLSMHTGLCPNFYSFCNAVYFYCLTWLNNRVLL